MAFGFHFLHPVSVFPPRRARCAHDQSSQRLWVFRPARQAGLGPQRLLQRASAADGTTRPYCRRRVKPARDQATPNRARLAETTTNSWRGPPACLLRRGPPACEFGQPPLPASGGSLEGCRYRRRLEARTTTVGGSARMRPTPTQPGASW